MGCGVRREVRRKNKKVGELERKVEVRKLEEARGRLERGKGESWVRVGGECEI